MTDDGGETSFPVRIVVPDSVEIIERVFHLAFTLPVDEFVPPVPVKSVEVPANGTSVPVALLSLLNPEDLEGLREFIEGNLMVIGDNLEISAINTDGSPTFSLTRLSRSDWRTAQELYRIRVYVKAQPNAVGTTGRIRVVERSTRVGVILTDGEQMTFSGVRISGPRELSVVVVPARELRVTLTALDGGPLELVRLLRVTAPRRGCIWRTPSCWKAVPSQSSSPGPPPS